MVSVFLRRVQLIGTEGCQGLIAKVKKSSWLNLQPVNDPAIESVMSVVHKGGCIGYLPFEVSCIAKFVMGGGKIMTAKLTQLKTKGSQLVPEVDVYQGDVGMQGLQGFPITSLREETIGKRIGNRSKPYIHTCSGDIQPVLVDFPNFRQVHWVSAVRNCNGRKSHGGNMSENDAVLEAKRSLCVRAFSLGVLLGSGIPLEECNAEEFLAEMSGGHDEEGADAGGSKDGDGGVVVVVEKNPKNGAIGVEEHASCSQDEPGCSSGGKGYVRHGDVAGIDLKPSRTTPRNKRDGKPARKIDGGK